MFSTRTKQLASVLSATALLVVTGTFTFANPQPAPARSAHERPGAREGFERDRAIVGTWRVQVQSYVCGTSTPVGPLFSSVLTFGDGGTLIGSTINPAFAVGQRGIDQGTWSYSGNHTYTAKDVAFLFFTTPPSPPANPGFLAGTQILSQTITVMKGGDEFTSEATTEFFDATAKSYRQGCATATAQRFE